MELPKKNFFSLENPLKNYNFTDKLGSGKYGKVYKAFRQGPD